MAILLKVGAEPIAGYQLMEKLGSGGYGEVWKVMAPGGLVKAIKVIFGHMSDARAEQELRALSRIKEVRHPFILSLERIEIIEEQLFIVTELADSSLMDRFEECRKGNKPGIPREELLGYLRDAADALDFMNEQFDLQHLDIKPQNLLLVGKHIKLADFGLVKDLSGAQGSVTGGVTPIYACPEVFDGVVTRFSDQYSLAIVYQEMLTGLRPFPGKTALQLAVQHMNSPPLLDPLPPADRAVIGRALAKVPEQRFPTCREMVENLFHPVPFSSPYSGSLSPESQEQFDEQLLHSEDFALGPALLEESSAGASANLLARDTIAEFSLLSAGGRTPPQGQPAGPPRLPLPVGEISLRPTLFVGLGGLAGATLRRLRHRLHFRFGSLASVPILRMLLLDTDRAGLRAAQAGDTRLSLRGEETMLVPLHKPEHYRADQKEILRWLDRRWLYGIPRSQLTEGMRPLARLALVDNFNEILPRLKDLLTQITSPQARTTTEENTGLGIRKESPRICLIASIAGATGGGMVLDAAYALRQLLTERNISPEGIEGILLHATSYDPAKRDLARVNALATLTELHHYSRLPYPGDPSRRLLTVQDSAPLPDCYLLHLGDQLSEAEAEAATDAVAEYLYLDAATTSGPFLDQYRQATRKGPTGTSVSLRTFGLHKVSFPRHALVEATALRFCRQIVREWRGDSPSTSGPDQVQDIESTCRSLEVSLGLDNNLLEKRFRQTVREFWKGKEDVYLDGIGPAVILEPFNKKAQVTSEIALRVLDRIDDFFDLPREGAQPAIPGNPLNVLSKKAEEWGAELGRNLVEGLVRWLDKPRHRVKPTEKALRTHLDHLAQLAETSQAKLSVCERSRKDCRLQLSDAEELAKSGGARWLGLGRRQPTLADLRRRFVDYGLLRLQEVELSQSARVFRIISNRLKEVKEILAVGKETLEHLAEQFQVQANPQHKSSSSSTTEVFPEKTANLLEGAEKILHSLGGAFALQFEEQLQEEYLRGRGGLWGLFSQQRDWVESIREEMLRRAQAALTQQIRGLDAAQLLLDSFPEPEQREHALRQTLQASFPKLLQGTTAWRHLVMSLPDSPAGARVKEIMAALIPDLARTALTSEGDLVFCSEGAGLPMSVVAARLVDQEKTYLDIARKVLTRIDVAWAPLPFEG